MSVVTGGDGHVVIITSMVLVAIVYAGDWVVVRATSCVVAIIDAGDWDEHREC